MHDDPTCFALFRQGQVEESWQAEIGRRALKRHKGDLLRAAETVETWKLLVHTSIKVMGDYYLRKRHKKLIYKKIRRISTTCQASTVAAFDEVLTEVISGVMNRQVEIPRKKLIGYPVRRQVYSRERVEDTFGCPLPSDQAELEVYGVLPNRRSAGYFYQASFRPTVPVTRVDPVDDLAAAIQARWREAKAEARAGAAKGAPRRPVAMVVRATPGAGKTRAVLKLAGERNVALFLQSHALCAEKAQEFLQAYPTGRVSHFRGTSEVLRSRGEHKEADQIDRLTKLGYQGRALAALLGLNITAQESCFCTYGPDWCEDDTDTAPSLIVATHAALAQLDGSTKTPSRLATLCQSRLVVVDEQPIDSVYHWNPYRLNAANLKAYGWRHEETGAIIAAGKDFAPIHRLVKAIFALAWPNLMAKFKRAADMRNGVHLTLHELVQRVDWKKAPRKLRRAYKLARAAVIKKEVRTKNKKVHRILQKLASRQRMPAPPTLELAANAPERNFAELLSFAFDAKGMGGKVQVVLTHEPAPDWDGWKDLREEQEAWEKAAAEEEEEEELDFDDPNYWETDSDLGDYPETPAASSTDDPAPFLRVEHYRGSSLARFLKGRSFILLDATADTALLHADLAETHNLSMIRVDHPLRGFTYRHIEQSTARSTLRRGLETGKTDGAIWHRIRPVLMEGYQKVGIVATKDYAEIIQAQVEKGDGLLGAFLAGERLRGRPVEVVVGYHGNLRGTNVFEDCDALVVWTDPKPNLGGVERAALAQGVCPARRLFALVEAELEQALGRARLVHRSLEIPPLAVYSVGMLPPVRFVEALGEPIETIEGGGGRVELPARTIGAFYTKAIRQRIGALDWCRMGAACTGDFEKDRAFIEEVLELAGKPRDPSDKTCRRNEGLARKILGLGTVRQVWEFAITARDLASQRVSEIAGGRGVRTKKKATRRIREELHKRDRDQLELHMAVRRVAYRRRVDTAPSGLALVGDRPEGLVCLSLPIRPSNAAPPSVHQSWARSVTGRLRKLGKRARWVDREGIWVKLRRGKTQAKEAPPSAP